MTTTARTMTNLNQNGDSNDDNDGDNNNEDKIESRKKAPGWFRKGVTETQETRGAGSE